MASRIYAFISFYKLTDDLENGKDRWIERTERRLRVPSTKIKIERTWKKDYLFVRPTVKTIPVLCGLPSRRGLLNNAKIAVRYGL